MHVLDELDFYFDVIGVSETKVSNSDFCVPEIPGYNFEFAPTPLACGGISLFMDKRHS